MQMRLPNAHQAVVAPEKITGYLLSDANEYSAAKADFFYRFGFRRYDWQILANALRQQGANNGVVRTVETAYGLHYIIDGIIETPDGRNPLVRTVWQIATGTDYPRLITARPLRR